LNSGNVSNCYSESSIAEGRYLGSVCGQNLGDISNCYSIGLVTGDIFLGGIYGTKAVGFLQLARAKSAALKEIVEGNELLKNKSSELAAEFKAAQAGQSAATKQIVAEVKS